MFPHGVIYEGVSEEPMSFRGESGANDSMIPMCDNLLQVSMPDTPLTDILKDFRQYRPGNHREFLEAVRDSSQESGIREFAKGDSVSAALYLQALDQVRDFRWRHWCFTREYILKHTNHPTATGGSPIVTVRQPFQTICLFYTDTASVATKPASSGACADGRNFDVLPGHQWC
jgi:indoleamine 2,3-dioxygenase